MCTRDRQQGDGCTIHGLREPSDCKLPSSHDSTRARQQIERVASALYFPDSAGNQYLEMISSLRPLSGARAIAPDGCRYTLIMAYADNKATKIRRWGSGKEGGSCFEWHPSEDCLGETARPPSLRGRRNNLALYRADVYCRLRRGTLCIFCFCFFWFGILDAIWISRGRPLAVIVTAHRFAYPCPDFALPPAKAGLAEEGWISKPGNTQPGQQQVGLKAVRLIRRTDGP